MKFKLLCGTHYENGVRHKAGDVVESDRLLDEVFSASRFERLGSDGESHPSEEVEAPRPRRRRVTVNKDEEVEATVGQLSPKHKGGGRWVVINEETGEQVNDGYLSKQEALDLAGAEG